MIPTYAQKTKETGVWNCPTVVVWQKLFPEEIFDEMSEQPLMQYISPLTRVFWKKSIVEMNKHKTYEGTDYAERMQEISNKMIRELHEAGAGLLLGTDVQNPFVFPGFSIHEELKYMVDAGLTPYQAIKMGTRNAAEFLGKLDEFGTVSVGKRADLVMLGGNPLQDISHFHEISGVMIHGRWLQQGVLDMMLGELAESYKKQNWKIRLKTKIISFLMSF